MQVALVKEEGGAVVGAGFGDAMSSGVGVTSALAGLAIEEKFTKGPLAGLHIWDSGLPKLVFDLLPPGDDLATGDHGVGSRLGSKGEVGEVRQFQWFGEEIGVIPKDEIEFGEFGL